MHPMPRHTVHTDAIRSSRFFRFGLKSLIVSQVLKSDGSTPCRHLLLALPALKLVFISRANGGTVRRTTISVDENFAKKFDQPGTPPPKTQRKRVNSPGPCILMRDEY